MFLAFHANRATYLQAKRPSLQVGKHVGDIRTPTTVWFPKVSFLSYEVALQTVTYTLI